MHKTYYIDWDQNNLVPDAGIEPTTSALSKHCSTAELIWPKIRAGLLGFEPRLTESKSGVLPLHYRPIELVGVENFEISTYWLKASYSSSELHPQILVPPLGIEPSSTILQTVAMTTSAKAAWGV